MGRVLLSFATLAELDEVLSRKKFLRYVDWMDLTGAKGSLGNELLLAWLRKKTSLNEWETLALAGNRLVGRGIAHWITGAGEEAAGGGGPREGLEFGEVGIGYGNNQKS
jgi:hypothetical protein